MKICIHTLHIYVIRTEGQSSISRPRFSRTDPPLSVTRAVCQAEYRRIDASESRVSRASKDSGTCLGTRIGLHLGLRCCPDTGHLPMRLDIEELNLTLNLRLRADPRFARPREQLGGIRWALD